MVIFNRKLAGKSSLQIADSDVLALLTHDSPSDSVKPVFSDIQPLTDVSESSGRPRANGSIPGSNFAPQRHTNEQAALGR